MLKILNATGFNLVILVIGIVGGVVLTSISFIGSRDVAFDSIRQASCKGKIVEILVTYPDSSRRWVKTELQCKDWGGE